MKKKKSASAAAPHLHDILHILRSLSGEIVVKTFILPFSGDDLYRLAE